MKTKGMSQTAKQQSLVVTLNSLKKKKKNPSAAKLKWQIVKVREICGNRTTVFKVCDNDFYKTFYIW